MVDIEARLADMGLELPGAPAPAANYIPWTVSGTLVFVAGQIPVRDGSIVTGRLGLDVSVDEGAAAAELCALNLLAQAKAAAGGDTRRIARCLKLGGFVQCTPDFTDHPEVINGASNLVVAAMGDAGRHARFAVGAPSLPRGAVVEVEAIFALV